MQPEMSEGKVGERPTKTVIDRFGNNIKVPTTTEAGDWFAICQCGKVCGGTFGHKPNDDDRNYVACPVCGAAGQPQIEWHELPPATPAAPSEASEQRLTAEEWQRLREWARDQNRQAPSLAFTSGLLRDVADAVWCGSLPKGPPEPPPIEPAPAAEQSVTIQLPLNMPPGLDRIHDKMGGHICMAGYRFTASQLIAEIAERPVAEVADDYDFPPDKVKAALQGVSMLLHLINDKIHVATHAPAAEPATREPAGGEVRGKDTLTKDDPVGIYLCHMKSHQSDYVVQWDGKTLWLQKAACLACHVEHYTNFRGPLVPHKAGAGEVERLKRERELLAQGIAQAAKAFGIIDGSQPLTGPHLLRLCDDLGNIAVGYETYRADAEQLRQRVAEYDRAIASGDLIIKARSTVASGPGGTCYVANQEEVGDGQR